MSLCNQTHGLGFGFDDVNGAFCDASMENLNEHRNIYSDWHRVFLW